MTYPFGESVTISRPSGTSRYGDPLPPTDIPLTGVVFAPRYSTELSDQRSTVIIGLTMYGPYSMDVKPYDRLVRNGVTWEIEGEPGRWKNPYTGLKAGCEVSLKRVTG